MANEQIELINILRRLDNTISKFSGYFANMNNGSDNGTSYSKNDTKKDDDGLGKMRENLKKHNAEWKKINIEASRNAEKLNKTFGDGFKDIFKKVKDSVINVIPSKTMERNISRTMDNMEKSFKMSSIKAGEKMSEYFKNKMKETNNNVSELMSSTGEITKGFENVIKIMNGIQQSGIVTKKQIEILGENFDNLKDEGFDLKEMFNDMGHDFDSFSKIFKKSQIDKIELNKAGMESTKKMQQEAENAMGDFVDSTLELSKTIKNETNNLKDKLKGVIGNLGKGAIAYGVKQEYSDLSAMQRTGMRGIDAGSLLDFAIGSADRGASQSEMAQAISSNRTMLRMFTGEIQSANVLNNEKFNSSLDLIRDKFNIIGGDAVKFFGNELNTFKNLGVEPSIKALNEYTRDIQVLGNMTDMIPEEINQMFANLSKDKGFKEFFSRIDKSNKGLGILTKTSLELRKNFALTMPQILEFAQSFATSTTNKKFSTRLVEIEFAKNLFALNKDTDAFKNFKGGKSGNGLTQEDIDIALRAYRMRGVGVSETDMSTALNVIKVLQKANLESINKVSGTPDEQYISTLMENAGMFGETDANAFNNKTSGLINSVNGSFDETMEKALGEHSNAIKLLNQIAENTSGFLKSPIGKMGAGIFGAMGGIAELYLTKKMAQRGIPPITTEGANPKNSPKNAPRGGGGGGILRTMLKWGGITLLLDDAIGRATGGDSTLKNIGTWLGESVAKTFGEKSYEDKLLDQKRDVVHNLASKKERIMVATGEMSETELMSKYFNQQEYDKLFSMTNSQRVEHLMGMLPQNVKDIMNPRNSNIQEMLNNEYIDFTNLGTPIIQNGKPIITQQDGKTLLNYEIDISSLKNSETEEREKLMLDYMKTTSAYIKVITENQIKSIENDLTKEDELKALAYKRKSDDLMSKLTDDIAGQASSME